MRNKRYRDAGTSPNMIRNDLRYKLRDLSLFFKLEPKFAYAISDYILHVFVERTDHIDTADTDSPGHTETIAYCHIIDNLKGQKIPSLENAIF
jgi:hypothetical protein